jgi:hypothetical protein
MNWTQDPDVNGMLARQRTWFHTSGALLLVTSVVLFWAWHQDEPLMVLLLVLLLPIAYAMTRPRVLTLQADNLQIRDVLPTRIKLLDLRDVDLKYSSGGIAFRIPYVSLRDKSSQVTAQITDWVPRTPALRLALGRRLLELGHMPDFSSYAGRATWRALGVRRDTAPPGPVQPAARH